MQGNDERKQEREQSADRHAKTTPLFDNPAPPETSLYPHGQRRPPMSEKKRRAPGAANEMVVSNGMVTNLYNQDTEKGR